MEAKLAQNELEVMVTKGQSCFFASKFLRNQAFSVDLKPKVKGAFLPRLLHGRLWDLYLQPTIDDQRVSLAGDDPQGRFVCRDISEGQVVYIKLKYLAAYQIQKGGRFRRINGLFKFVNWLTWTPLAVCIEGPAWVAFYGTALANKKYESGQIIFCDQVIAMDARAKFDLEALAPDKASYLGQSLNAISTTVVLKFQNATDVIYSTIRKEKFSRLVNLPILILGFLIFTFVVERLVLRYFGVES